MARSGRGGSRTPRNPAPVSGPGALSRRTDGPVQPVRVAPGGKYGERKALTEQQQSAPLAAGGGASPPPPSPAPLPSVFGPTGRPNESIRQGIPTQPAAQSLAQLDADALLRILVRRYPHPQLVRLLQRG